MSRLFLLTGTVQQSLGEALFESVSRPHTYLDLNIISFFERVEKIAGNEENAGYKTTLFYCQDCLVKGYKNTDNTRKNY